ncbi:hypothetical protein F441_21941 [Phytophthora nicotianae CJ01A1]|uniref:Uncharacterized protein n=1 Tax=Phytophthora nicotianae CJ01A1 TaxID=1317063 RepID=W2VQT0_PHYNI|nr:hypothetical protein F441_21941 [Phytophthora nicotianae CJ01A1]
MARTHVASLASLTSRAAPRSTWILPGAPRGRCAGRHNTLPGSSCANVSLIRALDVSLATRTKCFFIRGSRSGRGKSSSTGGSVGSEWDFAEATDGGGAGRDILRVIVCGIGMVAGGMTL